MKERLYKDDDIGLWGNSEPVCPYCDHKQEMTDLINCFASFEDGAVMETECDVCEKPFHIELNMPVKYNTFVDYQCPIKE